MSYLIIILVVAFVLGPVMWLMPSPAQRRQETLRSHAQQLGLQIKIVDLPQSERERVRQNDTQQGVRYQLPIPRSRAVVNHRIYLLLRLIDGEQGDGYEWQGLSSDELQALLQRTLQNFDGVAVRALEVNPTAVAVYWRESGGVEGVDEIAGLLEDLRDEVLQTEEFRDV